MLKLKKSKQKGSMQLFKKFLLLPLILAVITGLFFAFSQGMMPVGNMHLYGPMMSDDVETTKTFVAPANEGMGTSAVAEGMPADMMQRNIAPYLPYYNDDALSVEDRVYEKFAYQSAVVSDVDAYTKQLEEYVLSINGRVLSSSISQQREFQVGYIMAKVPETKFQEAVNRIAEGVKKVVSKDINSQDITGSYTNTQEQVVALQDQIDEAKVRLEAATTDLEKRRIELEIQRLERQLASAQQQAGSVEQRITYATIQVSVADSERYFNSEIRPSLWEQFLRAWRSLSDIFYLLGFIGIWTVVYGIIWLPIFFVVKFVWGRVFARNKSVNTQE